MRRELLPTVWALFFAVTASSSLAAQDLPTVPEGFTVSVFARDLAAPLGLAFAPDGDLVVCTWDEGVAYRIDPQGAKTVINYGLELPHVSQSVTTGDGRTFLTAGGSSAGARIWEIISGMPVLFYEGQGAYGIEWDGDASLYFTQSPTGSVLRSDLEGNTTVFASELGVGLADVRFGPDGKLYAANDDNGTIFRIDSDGSVEPFMTHLPRPEMLAFDHEGNLYFTAFTFSKIYKVDAEKHVSLFLTGIRDTDIRGIAFDSAGNLFACDGVRGLVYKVNTVSPPVTKLRQIGPRCVSVDLANSQSIKGGEIGISYDPSKVVPVKVSAGPDFPIGGDLHVDLNPPVACSSDPTVSAGLTIAWLNPISGNQLMAPGTHELVKICFAPAEGAEPDACSDLSFTACLGPQEAPIRNVVTDASGRSVALPTASGAVCIGEELEFRRGDANSDGSFDISDPIGILGCLFLGTDCSRCADASDANDDGTVNIADPTYLLHWRFLGGPAPPSPFSACGRDPTVDAVDECESFPICQ